MLKKKHIKKEKKKKNNEEKKKNNFLKDSKKSFTKLRNKIIPGDCKLTTSKEDDEEKKELNKNEDNSSMKIEIEKAESKESLISYEKCSSENEVDKFLIGFKLGKLRASKSETDLNKSPNEDLNYKVDLDSVWNLQKSQSNVKNNHLASKENLKSECLKFLEYFQDRNIHQKKRHDKEIIFNNPNMFKNNLTMPKQQQNPKKIKYFDIEKMIWIFFILFLFFFLFSWHVYLKLDSLEYNLTNYYKIPI